MGDNELMFIFLITLVLIVFAVTPDAGGLNTLAQDVNPDSCCIQIAFDQVQP